MAKIADRARGSKIKSKRLPKSRPKASLEASRWLQNASQKRLRFLIQFSSSFCRFWRPQGGGAERQNGFQNRFKNGLGFKARSFHPGAHVDPLGPRFWSLRELIFEASPASSAAWPEARSPRSAWLTNGGRRCWRSHSQSADHRLRCDERA